MANYRVTIDGVDYEINAPDDAAAQRAVQQLRQGGAAPAAASPLAAQPTAATPAQPQPQAPMGHIEWWESTRHPQGIYELPPANVDEIRQQEDPEGYAAYMADATGLEAPEPAGVLETLFPSMGRGLEIGLQGVGRGTANVLGAPGDLGNMLGNLGIQGLNWMFDADIPLSPRSPIGSEAIREAATPVAEAVGIPVREPEEMSGGERLMVDVNDFATQALLGGGALARLAGPARAATPTLAPQGTAPRVVTNLARPYREQPGGTLVRDSAGGAGAGAGNYLYNENAPEWVQEHPVLGPLGRVFATLGGGIGGDMAAGGAMRTGANTARNITQGRYATELPPNAATGEPFRRATVDDAALLFQQRANNMLGEGPSAQTAADEIAATQAALAPFVNDVSMPTAGLMSNNPGLIGLEQQTRQRNPDINPAFIARDRAVAEAAAGQIDNIAPANATGRQFTDAATRTQEGRVDEARQIAEPFVPAPNQRDQAARDIDTAVVEGNLRPAQEASSRQFAAVDPSRTAMLDVAPVQDLAAQIVADVGTLVDPATIIPAGLLGRIKKIGAPDEDQIDTPLAAAADEAIDAGPAQVAVGDIVEVWPNISSAIVRAQKAGNYTLADNLRAIRKEFGAMLEEAAAGGDEAAQRALDARQSYADTIGRDFGSRTVAAGRFRKDFNLDRFGRSTTPVEQTAGRFLRAGQPTPAAELKQILNNSADPKSGQRAVHDYLMADLAASGAVQDGFLRPDVLAKWRNRWGDALNVSPMTTSAIDEALKLLDQGAVSRGRLYNDVERARAAVANPEQYPGALGLVLGKDPTNAISAIFNSGDPETAIREVLIDIGSNPAALDGLKAAIREYLAETITTTASHTTTSGRNPVSPAKLNQLLGAYGDTLAEVFSPEEMQAFQTASTLLQNLQRRSNQALPGARTAEATAMEKILEPIELGARIRYGHLAAGGVMRSVRLALKQWAGTQGSEELKQLIAQVWFNPDFLRHVLMAENPGTPQWNAKLNRIIAAMSGVRDADQQMTETEEAPELAL
jgi:hypothetical protein